MKYARQCSVTGEGMNEGWLQGDGERYFKYEKDVIEWLKGWYGSDLNDDELLENAVEEDILFWTEWECPEDFQYEEINGKLIEINQ